MSKETIYSTKEDSLWKTSKILPLIKKIPDDFAGDIKSINWTSEEALE
jgi:hypothetical protein